MSSQPRQTATPVLAGVVLFGIAAIALGVTRIQQEIRPTPRAAGSVQTPEELDAAEQAALATRDTDGDGLTDAEELTLTHTSPYLADSDSDGVSDKDEIDQGQNPNCPRGRDCLLLQAGEQAPQPTAPGFFTTQPAAEGSGGISLDALLQQFSSGISNGTSTSSATPVIGAVPGVAPSATSIPPAVSAPNDAISAIVGAVPSIDQLIKQLPSTPSAVRQQLLQSGMAPDQLNVLDDAQLMELWNRSLDQIRAQAATQPSSGN